MRIVFLFALVLLAGCATSTSMHGPDGKEMLAIECHGSAQSPASCYKKAGEVCGERGYQIIGKDGEAIPMASGYAHANHYAGMAIQQAGMVVYRTLYVRCKEKND